jgi:riboflavin kinase/FMN adenylyltransferase
MEILSGIEALPDPRLRRPVVAWGVFDGVHRGHRRLLGAVLAWARAEGLPSALLTFDRHPAEVLHGRSIPLITPLAERLRLLGEHGIDFCVVLNFTKAFAQTSARDFATELLRNRLGARGLVLGHDSRFGKDREGDLALLEGLGIEVRQSEPEVHRGRPVSSSLVRESVLAGRLDEARFLLGRPPSVFGTVVRGARRGTSIGFPTANLALHHAVRPPGGVYAAEVPLEGRTWRAVANLGTRPTFEEGGAESVEVHLVGWSGGDLYGRVLEVRFLDRLRDERKFESVDALRKQIEADVALVRGGLMPEARGLRPEA